MPLCHVACASASFSQYLSLRVSLSRCVLQSECLSASFFFRIIWYAVSIILRVLQPQLLRDVYHPRFSIKTALLDKIDRLQKQSAALLDALSAPPSTAAAVAAAGDVSQNSSESPFSPEGTQQHVQQQIQQHQQQQLQQLQQSAESPGRGAPSDPTQASNPLRSTLGFNNHVLRKRSALKLGFMSLIEERAREIPDGNVSLGLRVEGLGWYSCGTNIRSSVPFRFSLRFVTCGTILDLGLVA